MSGGPGADKDKVAYRDSRRASSSIWEKLASASLGVTRTATSLSLKDKP